MLEVPARTRRRPSIVARVAAAWLTLSAAALPGGAQPPARAAMSGAQLYGAACANCHAADGRGAPRAQVGFSDALPDFTACAVVSPETAQDWQAIVSGGGPVRAFTHRMPAFGDALTTEQIERVVRYVRTFCRDRRWPRGELNLPRPIETEKAFPENETVVTASGVSRRGQRATNAAVIYERRIGPRSQYELVLPFGTRERENGRMTAVQLGDVAATLKHTLYHDSERGTILSAYTEGVFPTGSVSAGLGDGTVIVEPGLLFAQSIGSNAFLHAQTAIGVPFDTHKAEREALWRGALGTTVEIGSRALSPMIELVGARAIVAGASSEWDAIPQMQLSLSRRRHILGSVGLRLPLSERDTRPRELLTYLIWDWADGGLFDGWR